MTCTHCHKEIEDKNFLELSTEQLGTVGIFCNQCLNQNREGVISDIRQIVMHDPQ